jgi:ATP-dependent RNA circularization protein (DNA/RNA ligase family)
MAKFFRFPHTPHLAWLGAGEPRNDKVLSSTEAGNLLKGDVVVEEKVDGANLGFSLNSDGQLRAQNRGQYLAEPFTGQFRYLAPWLSLRSEDLASALRDGDLILFGEWCAARHSLDYDRLPDWFVVFDIYDRGRNSFWSSVRRNAVAQQLGLSSVSQVATGRFTVAQLKGMLATGSSCYRNGPMEGLVIRRETTQWCEARAKLVRADFTQALAEHWRRRALELNRIECAGKQA